MSRVGALRDVAEQQFGLFTAAQARATGVVGYELARWAKSGPLYRVRHGVYGFADSETYCWFEDIAAAWLALNPSGAINARRLDPEAVISHGSAARLRGLGSPAAFTLQWTSPRRINVQDRLVETRVGSFGTFGVDWDLLEGLPVSTPGRICADLLSERGDGGNVGTVIAACLYGGHVSLRELVDLAAPFATLWGCAAGDGDAVIDVLMSSTEVPIGA